MGIEVPDADDPAPAPAGPGSMAARPDAREPFRAPAATARPGSVLGALFIVLLLASVGIGGWLVVRGVSESRPPAKAGGAGDVDLGWLSERRGDGVAVVKIYGAIQMKEDRYPFGRGGGADGIVSQLKKLRKESRVKAVVVRVNSPGGTIAASQEIHNQVREIAKTRPVVVSMGDVAASGGYYVSAPATFIYANPGTITGSIGVITQLINYEKVIEKIGVTFPTFKSGRFKDMGSPSRPMTPEEEKLFTGIVLGAYDQFVDAVADGRIFKPESEKGKTSSGRVKVLKNREDVKQYADGRVMLGAEAKERGFVDGLGDLDDAVKKAGQLAGLGSDPKVIKPSAASFEELMEMFGSDGLGEQIQSLVDRSHAPVLYLYRPGL
jgi:protease-4